jgi:hypothetical protein
MEAKVVLVKNIDVRFQGDDYGNHKRDKKARVYFNIQDETVLENLQHRRSRPIKLFRALLPEVYKKLGVDSRARWSQYAGCSCPCSPGFILDDVYGKTVYVTV